MKFTIVTRAFEGPLFDRFKTYLPPPDVADFLPLHGIDGFEGALDFLLQAVRRTSGKIVICDLDCFVFDWDAVARLVESDPDYVVSERSIPHRLALPRYVGNPFFWVLDSDRAKTILGRVWNLYSAPGDVTAEPFWGLYYLLYYAHKLPVATIPVWTHADGIATQTAYFLHTWYSRDYGHDAEQTTRIDNLLSQLPCK
jgi:hypothetical protein